MTFQQFNKLSPEQQEQLRLQWRNIESGVPMISRMLFEDWLRKYAPDSPFDRDLIRAFRASFLPVNPIPFLDALSAGVKSNGTDWIKSDEAKALMWILMYQTFNTQTGTIDMHEEWVRLNEIF